MGRSMGRLLDPRTVALQQALDSSPRGSSG